MRPSRLALLASGIIALSLTGSNCDPPPDPPTPEDCGPGQVCRSGRCAVTVAPQSIPAGSRIRLDEEPSRPEIANEVLAPFVCTLRMPPNVTLHAPVRLSVFAQGAPPRAMLFRDDTVQPIGLTSSVANGPLVEVLTMDGGSYGLTQRPERWAIANTMPTDPLTSATTAQWLRNISLQSINAAYFDGTRLFVGDGPRILIFDGVPGSPAVKPRLILGQPELDKILPGTSASIGSAINAIWSNGQRLVAADGNRVLIWNRIPETSFSPADSVLGQQDFVSSGANVGGISASTLASPKGVESDGTRLLVTDTMNHRVLVWSAFPSFIGQPATSVLGQPTFANGEWGRFFQPGGTQLDDRGGVFVAQGYTGSAHFASLGMNAAPDFSPIDPSYPFRVRRDGLVWASSVAKLPTAGLAMSDAYAPRIGVHRAVPSSPTGFDFVLGQPDPDRAVRSDVSGSSNAGYQKVIAANGLVLVPDTSRLLVYEQTPRFNFEPASRVVGQAGFSVNDRGSDYRRISERTLAYPADVAVRGGLLAVADRGNNRVLLFPNSNEPTNRVASVVLGQPDAVSFVPNVDQRTASGATLSGPSGVSLDGTHLIVADTENHRVLIWKPVPTVSGTPATFVLGQNDFTEHRPNRGRADSDSDGSSDAGGDGLFYPVGVASDGQNLFVADRLNNRVLHWKDLSTITNGKSADEAIGQADLTSSKPNRNSAFVARADGLNLPTYVTLSGTSLWVSDTENNRLVRYDNALTAPTAAAVIGQPDLTTVSNANYAPPGDPNVGVPMQPPTTAASVLRPRGVTLTGTQLFVSEMDSHRVHIFERLATGAYAHKGQLGQSSDSTSIVNANGISASSLSLPQGLASNGEKLFVADAANHRVLSFTAPATLRSSAPASAVIGQNAFVANGFDQALATSAGGATQPRGMALGDGELFVAETSRHRIVVHELPLVPGKEPKRIIGQPDLSVSLPNVGGAPSATTLASPRGVYADSNRLVVADSANHRVLVYSPPSSVSASLVLGQASFTERASNRGHGSDASTLSSPEGVFVDENGHLAVADTGNHRVLVWSSFPTSNGQAADVVIGQATFTESLSNRGAGVATAGSLALPSAVHVANGKLFVADTGNNRVLGFDEVPSVSSPNASFVLGQPDFTTRIPTADINNDAKCAGPVALTSDGANLYVADRDTNRVLSFPFAELATGARAHTLFNANSGLVAAGPSGLAAQRTALWGSRLFVADTNKDQLLVVEGVSRLR